MVPRGAACALNAEGRMSDHVGGVPVTNIDVRIPEGNFLVFYFLTRDHIRCDRDGKFLDGSNEAGILFESFGEAEALARSVSEISPRIGSGIYNSSWKILAEFLPEVSSSNRLKQIRRVASFYGQPPCSLRAAC